MANITEIHNDPHYKLYKYILDRLKTLSDKDTVSHTELNNLKTELINKINQVSGSMPDGTAIGQDLTDLRNQIKNLATKEELNELKKSLADLTAEKKELEEQNDNLKNAYQEVQNKLSVGKILTIPQNGTGIIQNPLSRNSNSETDIVRIDGFRFNSQVKAEVLGEFTMPYASRLSNMGNASLYESYTMPAGTKWYLVAGVGNMNDSYASFTGKTLSQIKSDYTLQNFKDAIKDGNGYGTYPYLIYVPEKIGYWYNPVQIIQTTLSNATTMDLTDNKAEIEVYHAQIITPNESEDKN